MERNVIEGQGMAQHPLESHYGLTSFELLEAVTARFRLKVALEGAVAEVQMEKKIASLVGSVVERYEAHDLDGHPDFSIWIAGRDKPLLAECKNVRDRDEAYR
jgi:hypothetical protein